VNYFITREGQQYGPYTLADLQRYAASGEVLVTDLAISDASSEPVPVSQIIGTIAVPAPMRSAMPGAEMQYFPDPPNLHWALVLLFAILSCGIFSIVWDIVQAAWLKKVEPASNALLIYCGAAAAWVGIVIASVLATTSHTSSLDVSIMQLVYAVALIWARFSFRSSMEQHFNTAEPMGLSLSGVMTFFFGSIYFQYHINDIVHRKRQDLLFQATR
jgi:hypothetical protein